MRPYNEALIKIYLFEGVHHYINCIDPEDINLPEDVLCDDQIIKICADQATWESLQCGTDQ